ncbi:sarcosine oxidase subunit gamma [Gordonia sp. TBRC 11910]|uniref:Sarcosine oxidase subunit gamma n=1 Tax=Gordonia asplenii TaxID=2725283 RepID=A0A848KSQ8_9ACTN|nr:sarcosine oxidase subunit gamma family protein [Gordonia asplenii]NMO01716.1 sarcosine oxidase subunit gamma [Gordonia asplenii]
MADTLQARSPLHNWTPAFASLGGAVSIVEEPFVAMVDIWTDNPGDARISSLLGVTALPTMPNTAVSGDTTTVIWLGPGEWLATSSQRSGLELERQLIEALTIDASEGAFNGAVADVSAQRTTVRLSGPRARDVLAKGCSLDLHPSAFAPGQAAQTMLAQAAIILLPLDVDDYRILVRSTFADYLAEWLLDAAAEYS